MSELKPCFKCGDERIQRVSQSNLHNIYCRSCGTSGKWFPTLREAVEDWQFRPAENKIKAEGVRDACGRIFPCNDEQEGYQQSLLEYAHNLENNDA